MVPARRIALFRTVALTLVALLVAGQSLLHTGAAGALAGATAQLYLPLVLSSYDVIGPHPFGVQMYGTISDNHVSYEALRRSRAHWVRLEVSWAASEGNRSGPEEAPQYNWYMDQTMQNARDLGLNLIVTIVTNPVWASMESAEGPGSYLRNGPIEPPSLVSELARFVGAMAARYPWVTHFEFYNEPDGSHELSAATSYPAYWGDYGDRYAAMLEAVYPAIKAANPQAKVVMGGLAADRYDDLPPPFAEHFMDDVLEHGGGDYFDVMNVHYYPWFAGNWTEYGGGLAGKVDYFRNKLAAHGYDKPIICTEIGFPSALPSFNTSEVFQATMVARLFTESLVAGLDTVIWWHWQDFVDGTGGRYGLVNNDLTPKLAVEAFRAATLHLGDVDFVEAYDVQVTASAYRFIGRGNSDRFVIWSHSEQTVQVALPLAHAAVYDVYGALVAEPTAGADGHVTVAVGAAPVYVVSLR